MVDVPESPVEFFTEFVPARFAPLEASVAGKSSAGCMVFSVTGVGDWSLRLRDGKLVVNDGVADDVIIRVTMAEADFGPIVVSGARLQGDEVPDVQKQVLAFKALTIDEQLADAVRKIVGNVAFVVTDAGEARRITMTPGSAEPNVESPECRLECTMDDFVDMTAGRQQAVQLAMSGKIKMSGNLQIAMALSAVFV